MATDAEIEEYYADLLITQYRRKPKARAEVKLLAAAGFVNQLPLQTRNAFHPDNAVGAQLDILLKYVGGSRTVQTFTTTVTLVDADARTLLFMLIARNHTNGSLDSIDELIQNFFPGQVKVFDHQNMRMDYFLESSIGSATLAEAMIKGRALPKPSCVQLFGRVRCQPDEHFWYAGLRRPGACRRWVQRLR
jgi:hypothetical protein